MHWIFNHRLFHLVFEVCNKPKVILQLDHQGLIVIVLPGALNFALLTLVQVSAFAVAGFGTEVVVNHDLPDVFIDKLPLMVLTQDLYSIGVLMRAHLANFKEVDGLSIGANVEVPYLVMDLSSQTCHWLVSKDYSGAQE